MSDILAAAFSVARTICLAAATILVLAAVYAQGERVVAVALAVVLFALLGLRVFTRRK